MPEIDGISLTKMIKENFPEIDVMIVTGYDTDYSFKDVIKAGASDFVTKPSVPKAAININASGTPPVFASTEAVAATALRVREPVFTMALAIKEPATAPIKADITESRIET